MFPWVTSRASMLYLSARTHNHAAVCLHAARIAALREFWTDLLPWHGNTMVLHDHSTPCEPVPGENSNADYPSCAKLVYRASQFEADAQIGRLLDTLDAMELSKKTMVIFSGAQSWARLFRSADYLYVQIYFIS